MEILFCLIQVFPTFIEFGKKMNVLMGISTYQMSSKSVHNICVILTIVRQKDHVLVFHTRSITNQIYGNENVYYTNEMVLNRDIFQSL